MDIQIPSSSSSSPPPTPLVSGTVDAADEDAPSPTSSRKRKSSASHASIAGPSKKTKSRNGCLTCKKKRLKCDETWPTCLRCTQRKVICEGYRKEFKWKPCDQTAKVTIGNPGDDNAAREQALPPGLTNAQSTRELQICFENAHSSLSRMDDHDRPHVSSNPQVPQIFSLYTSKSPPARVAARLARRDDGDVRHRRFGSSSESHAANVCDSTLSPQDDYDESLGFTSYDHSTITGSTWQSASRPHDSTVQPSSHLITSVDGMTQASGSFRDSSSALSGLTRASTVDHTAQISRPIFTPPGYTGRSQSSTPQAEVSALKDISYFSSIGHQASSPDMLLRRFEQQTCGILSVKDGPSENPWRTLIWPLAQRSPALYHAILSMAAFHGAKELPGLHTAGMKHMTQAIERLASEIEHMQFDTALAIALALAFCEGWDSHVSTGVRHLVAARFLVNKSMAKHYRNLQQGRLSNPEVNRVRFLCNTFVYMDVIARLTHSQVSDVDLQEILDTVNTAKGELHIDPMMGCAMTLFPLLGRVATLIQSVRKASSNSLNMVSAAIELEEQLQDWVLPDAASFKQPEDPHSKVQHCVQTAEAYRQATLLYLHQAVPEIPSEPTEATAKRILLTLASVPLSSRTTIIQIFPLFVASCEMTDAEDRDWVMRRWAAMIDRLQIGNLDSCWTVVQEVWNRRDVHRSEDVSKACRAGLGRGGALQGRLGEECTVRGKLHWLGVMKEWDWEGESVGRWLCVFVLISPSVFL